MRRPKVLQLSKRTKRGSAPAYRVKAFDPRGIYPEGTIFVPNGFFHADQELAFSVVLGQDWHELDPDIPYSEFAWASPQELRLLASMVLCERIDDRRLHFYPLRYGFCVDADNLDLAESETVARLKEFVLDEVLKPDVHGRPSTFVERRTRPYDLEPSTTYAFDRLQDFWEKLSDLNYVLLRGMGALIKADMLTCHDEFYEEGVVSCYIALDASHAYILDMLRLRGFKNPTTNDAQQWVHNCFNKAFGLPAPSATCRYFDDFYDERIMTMHPSSRLGEIPYAPIARDDYIQLRRDLREIFAYLISGNHGADYHA